MTVKLQQKHHRKRYEIITPYLVGMATVTLPTQTLRHWGSLTLSRHSVQSVLYDKAIL